MAEISAKLVKELRDKTGVGMMECKKALAESDGDMEKAIEILRTKGRAKAEKRADKAASEGIIEAYIHPGSKLGVMVELNCETDFVAKTEDFVNLAKDLAMQVAAQSPLVVDREQVDKSLIEKELEIYKEQARQEGKPDKIIDKIAEGKLEKFYSEVCLMEQTFIKDNKKTVKDIITEAAGKLGENMKIGRFARFRLGGE